MEKAGGKKKIAVYSRKSKFTGVGESVENQIQWCRQYTLSHFEAISGDDILIYEDEGFSGGNTKRPQFQKMMEDAKTGKFSAVVCYRLDRISRNIQDFAKLIEELSALDIAFISIKEQFDTSSPLGRAMMYIASVFSQLEHETIAERIKDNMRELAKTGRWLGGTTPTGYASGKIEKVAIDGKIKKACRLTPIHQELELVRLLFARFLADRSLTKTETYLIQNGYKTKNSKPFTRFAIKNILKNPVYMTADAAAWDFFVLQGIDLCASFSDFDGIHGIMAYNKTIQKSGKANKTRDLSEWIVAVGSHKGVVSGADWVLAQGLLAQNGSKAYRRPKGSAALLSGLLFCQNCGHFMRPKLSRRKNAEGEYIYGYLCELKEKSRGLLCGMKNPSGNLLDNAVLDAAGRLPVHRGELIALLEEGKKALLAAPSEWEAEYARLNRAAEEQKKEIASLISSLPEAKDTPAREYIVDRINALHEKKQSLEAQKEKLAALAEAAPLPESRSEELKRQLLSFYSTLPSQNTQDIQEGLRRLIERIVWDGENAHIYFQSSGQ